MRVKEAIVSSVRACGFEFSDDTTDSLIERVCIDRGVTTGATYSETDGKNVDLCTADVILLISTHPSFKEGDLTVQMNQKDVLTIRKRLYQKYGLSPPEFSNKKKNIEAYERYW